MHGQDRHAHRGQASACPIGRDRPRRRDGGRCRPGTRLPEQPFPGRLRQPARHRDPRPGDGAGRPCQLPEARRASLRLQPQAPQRGGPARGRGAAHRHEGGAGIGRRPLHRRPRGSHGAAHRRPGARQAGRPRRWGIGRRLPPGLRGVANALARGALVTRGAGERGAPGGRREAGARPRVRRRDPVQRSAQSGRRVNDRRPRSPGRRPQGRDRRQRAGGPPHRRRGRPCHRRHPDR